MQTQRAVSTCTGSGPRHTGGVCGQHIAQPHWSVNTYSLGMGMSQGLQEYPLHLQPEIQKKKPVSGRIRTEVFWNGVQCSSSSFRQIYIWNWTCRYLKKYIYFNLWSEQMPHIYFCVKYIKRQIIFKKKKHSTEFMVAPPESITKLTSSMAKHETLSLIARSDSFIHLGAASLFHCPWDAPDI